MSDHHLSRQAMFISIEVGYEKANDVQTKTIDQSIKLMISDLSCVGRCRIPGMSLWGKCNK